MEIKFKYNVGNTVTLMKRPSRENIQFGKYISESEFKPKEYVIAQCKCLMKGVEEPKILYNLHAYCDEYIQFHNWIPEDELEGDVHEHIETFEFISHDKKKLHIGDVVLADVFCGSYDNPYLVPSMSFGVVTPILGLEYLITEKSNIIKTALVEENNFIRTEYTPYLVKDIDENFALEYVKFCKSNRFNPIKEAEKKYRSHHRELLESVNLWDKVVEIYNNWNKYRVGKTPKKTTEKKSTPKKNTAKANMKKLLTSLSETEIEELKKLINK